MDTKEDFMESADTNEFSTEETVSPSKNEVVVDYTSVFTTNEYFKSREELLKWVRNVANDHGMVVVVKRSDNGGGKRKPRLFLGCERSGPYREYKQKSLRVLGDSGLGSTIEEQERVVKCKDKETRKRETGTKKCDCPFLLWGKDISLNEWALEVRCGVHNHPVAVDLIGHPYAGRLSKVQEKFVVDMSKSNSRPRDILHMVHQKFPKGKCILKTIYNARLKHKVNERQGKSQMQYLLGKVKEHGYFFHHRRCEQTNMVKDILFAHPTSVALLRTFSRVLLIDCTYKTNRYKLPMFEIVGVTSTSMTFQVACAFMSSEREDNYIWACNILKSLMNQSFLPNVIVTDREIALMNAIEMLSYI